MQDTLTIQEASIFITNYLQRSISPSNISYLIQYGRIRKNAENGNTLIFKQDLLDYYHTAYHKQLQRREKLGDDLNWRLSFDQYKESETTKHVHRLHPYKGKFIPQLVEYFLNTTTDDFKTETFFQP
jgi:hypothetical protein